MLNIKHKKFVPFLDFDARDMRLLFILGILFLGLAIPRIIFPDLDHGDEFADANTLTAGKNFVKFGFWACRFLPMYEQQIDKPQNPYTHYPPLPEITNAIMRGIFKTEDLRIYRAFPLFFSLLNVFFWYLLVRAFSSSYPIAFLASLFYFTNPFFIFGMDSLWGLASSDFLRTVILFIFGFLAHPYIENRKRIFLFLWILVFLSSWVVFDYIVYLSLFFVLFRFFFRTEKGYPSRFLIFLLFLAPLLGFLLHFFQNAWYFGSLEKAIGDFAGIGIERIFKSKDAPTPEFNFILWWKTVILRNFSLIFMFNFFILGIALFLAYLMYQALGVKSRARLKIKSLLPLLVIFILCGITWYVIFPAHSYAHAYVHYLVRHILPVASLGFALFFYLVYAYIQERIYHKKLAKAVWVILVGLVLFRGIDQSDLPISHQKIKIAKDFLVFKECLLNLRNQSNPKDLICVNYYRFPFMRHYTDRNMLPIFDKASLEALKPLPRYFIFLARLHPATLELFEFLKERYNLISQCNSFRFPALIFKLKEEDASGKY